MPKKKPPVYAQDSNKPHLGGNFLELNPSTHAPEMWKFLIREFNIKSVLDVGSGLGFAAKWFADNGVVTTAIDGLDYNVTNAIHPTTKVDLTETSYVADVDLVHCVEVVEHIEEKYLDNLLNTLCCGKYLVLTHGVPGQPGHHHVNCQPREYWINHLKEKGYIEYPIISSKLKKLAKTAKDIKRTVMMFKRI